MENAATNVVRGKYMPEFSNFEILDGPDVFSLSRNISVAGLSTFVGIGTFSSDVFVAGTLTAGLIDGGIY